MEANAHKIEVRINLVDNFGWTGVCLNTLHVFLPKGGKHVSHD